MSASLAVHDAVVRAAIESCEGYVFSTAGDSFGAAFARASDAVAAALRAQSALKAATWPGPALRVRMGLHLGEADERDGDYFGAAVSTAARVAAAGHGGQVLATDSVRMTAQATGIDLGVHHLRDVAEPLRLYQLGEGMFPPLRSLQRSPTNLPVRPTTLIGRDDEVDQVRRLLVTQRLVTVTAVGGSGKTRVAIAAGEAELPGRGGGVWFADLAAVSSASEVPGAISNAVGLSLRKGDPAAQVVDHLVDKAALVILDNCEHVIDACAEFAERFLSTGGSSVLLATSREALGVDGECLLRLGPLAADGRDAPAVRLFAERAAAAGARFALDDENADRIGAICGHLDGMPLAIEFAAARITTMTLAELEAALDDRFTVLGGGRRPSRQRTLHATLDWSYDLLTAEEQHVLRALGAFINGFDIDAVTGVADMSRPEAIPILDALMSKSWVVRHDIGERTRFRLLETVKAYAEDCLAATGETVAARDRHLSYFHGLATSRGHTGIAELRLGVALRAERRNLTAAFEWAATTDRWPLAAEIITGAYPAYLFEGAALEACHLLRRALAAPTSGQPETGDPLHVALTLSSAWLTDWDTYTEAARALTESPHSVMRALGHGALGVPIPFPDTDSGLAEIQRARAELAATRAADHDLLSGLVAATIRWVEARVAAAHGNLQGGLDGCMDFLAGCRDIDYHLTVTPRAVKLAAICQILLGNPAGVTGPISWLEELAPGVFKTEDIQAYALIAQGHLVDAEPLVRDQAKEGLSGRGRLPGQVSDSVVLLAAFAHAEGDNNVAADLLRQMGAGLEPAAMLMSHRLAERIGFGVEHADLQEHAQGYKANDPQGLKGTRMAADAVRAELTRRGWE
jgi:predicted ATPase